jgi:hypothetical protein
MFEKKYRDLVNVCMYGMIGSKENKAIILFLVIALGTCAIYWSTSHWLSKGSLPAITLPLWAVLRGFGPAVAAIVSAVYLMGTPGLRELLSR